MRRGMLGLLLLSTLLIGTHPAGAQNPKISLRLENASLDEACAAISKASGVRVATYKRPADAPPAAPAPEPELRRSFDWSDTTFARALRQLCDSYEVRPLGLRQGGAYTLYPAPGQPAVRTKRVGLIQKNGLDIWVRSVSVSSQRNINFDGNGDDHESGSLSLQIGVLLGEGVGDRIAGVTNLSARDDKGSLLVADRDDFRSRFAGLAGGVVSFPDEWAGYLSFPGAAHPRAKKLDWVEGDLVAFKVYRPFTVEIPLPVPPGGARAKEGAVQVQLSGVTDSPSPNGGLLLQASIAFPPDGGITTPGGFPSPTLVGKSGRTYDAIGFSSSGGPMGVMQVSGHFAPIDESLVKAVFRFVEKKDPDKILSFRFTDIPIPQGGQFLIRQNRPPVPRAQSAVASPERPFQENGGGTLVVPVQILGKPAGEGSLSLGLSRRQGDGWTAIRWQDVTVGKDGMARVEELQPGRYRTLRVFKKSDPKVGETPAGHWQQSEVEVTVEAGKETTALPLCWLAGGVPIPAPPRPGPTVVKPKPK